ncbi:hypothetical protein ABES08_21225 [Peribacillus simplex]|uniref:hypothetical protein n=1 Tax=Peribacillus simplex TaxID=1478 RepID=UPI003CE9BED3
MNFASNQTESEKLTESILEFFPETLPVNLYRLSTTCKPLSFNLIFEWWHFIDIRTPLNRKGLTGTT